MSQEDVSDSNPTSPEFSGESDTQEATKTTKTGKKKHSKSAKPRLSAVQKNTNHKDAENKRRNAIRERFTELSRMVPGAEGQERSEQVMLGKTTHYLRRILEEQRQLESAADAQGIAISSHERLKDHDYGGSKWKSPHMDEYRAQKAKKGMGGSQGSKQDDDDDD